MAGTGVLLLTATIRPKAGVPNLRIRDPGERLAQYLCALKFATTLDPSVVTGIIFAENSASDLSPFADIARRDNRIELLNVEPAQVPDEWGRGYMETALVISASRRSQMVQGAAAPVWKVTGRYLAHNIVRIIAGAKPGNDLYVNLRNVPRPWGDMWVYGATAHGLSLLEEALPRLREFPGQPAEKSFYPLVLEFLARGEAVQPRLAAEPALSGVRGHDARPYNDFRQRGKWLVRSTLRKVAPRIWV